MNLIIAIHGILTRQTQANWPHVFQAWCARHQVNATVLTKEYEAGPIPLFNVHFQNRWLAKGLADEIELFFDDRRFPNIFFIAHSNGTDVALKTIQLLAARGIPTRAFIAVGSVLKSDIDSNGVQELVLAADLDRAISYSSNNDLAIKWGQHSLGYGGLGRTGWTREGNPLHSVTTFGDRAIPAGDASLQVSELNIFTRRFDAFGHGDYFSTPNIDAIFASFRKDCGLGERQRSEDGGQKSEEPSQTSPLRGIS